MKKKKLRFFYHFYKQYNCMSVHMGGKCYRTSNVDCRVPTETKWNKTQPRLVLQGWATGMIITDDKIVIFDENLTPKK